MSSLSTTDNDTLSNHAKQVSATTACRRFASTRLPWTLVLDETGIYVDAIVRLTVAGARDSVLAYYDDALSGLNYSLDNSIPLPIRCYLERFRSKRPQTLDQDDIRARVDRAQSSLALEMEKNGMQRVRQAVDSHLDMLLPGRETFEIELSDLSDWIEFPTTETTYANCRTCLDIKL